MGAAVSSGVVALTMREPINPTNDIQFDSLLVHNLIVLAILDVGVIAGVYWTGAVVTINGLSVGLAVGSAAREGVWSSILSGIAPHFAPEIAAYLLAAAGVSQLRREFRQGSLGGAHPLGSLSAFLLTNLVAIVLLTIAAIIETNVSRV
ncbi:stage II sporulation protein M [Sinomonas sp. ASV322]|uniref:stage II sporulation protein M n=1 Tax=Sinomonas sp. ASV322 TaxID=3041920 RepID=UPI0027DC93C6|nr:stage II sporulation protein M [Sinomonas sp. ASV322]MDQ4504311.1 stage II sporulation protein M [Sinomonas sp. ASV322]